MEEHKLHGRMLAIYNWILAPIPLHPRLCCIKVWFLRCSGVKIGRRLSLQSNVVIRGNGHLSIGDDVILRSGVVLECGSKVIIGDRVEVNHGTLIAANCGSVITIESDVHIAHYVSLKGSTHQISFTGPSVAGESVFKDINVKCGSWLCAGCIILPGVTVGCRNVVAAGAVVIKDSPDNVLLCGVPAKERKSYNIIGRRELA